MLFGGALLVGLLLTPARRELRQCWLRLGVVLAALLLLPNLVRQHDWASLEFYRNADRLKNVPTPPLEVLLQQVPFMDPAGEGKTGELPQWTADRFGWESFVERVGRAVEEELTPEERSRALILTGSYGYAGALELLGHDLPPVASVQNSYHLWGPGDSPAEVVITVGWSPADISALFEQVVQVDETRCGFCPRWRDGLPICIARRPRVPPREVWTEHFKSHQQSGAGRFSPDPLPPRQRHAVLPHEEDACPNSRGSSGS